MDKYLFLSSIILITWWGWGVLDFSICSIKANELLTNGHSQYYNLDQGYFMLLQTLESVEMKCEKNIRRVNANNIIIGRKFTLYNPSVDFVSFRGVVIKSEINVMPALDEEPILLHELHPGLHIMVSAHLNKINFQLNNVVEVITNVIPKLVETYNLKISVKNNVTKKRIDPRLIIVNRHIRKYYYTHLNLQVLADVIQCNPVYLSNTYSKVFKISPMRHIQNIRMKKARELLVTTNMPIYEIANKLGYVSSSQFVDLFKRTNTLTPRRYRLNHLRMSEANCIV